LLCFFYRQREAEGKEFLDTVKAYLQKSVKYRVLFVKTISATLDTEQNAQQVVYLPEYCVPYLIHLLAHHVHYEEQLNKYHFKDFLKVLYEVFEVLLQQGDNVGFLDQLIKHMPLMEDVLDPKSNKFRVICSLALKALEKLTENKKYSFASYPKSGVLPLPMQMYRRKDTTDSQEIPSVRLPDVSITKADKTNTSTLKIKSFHRTNAMSKEKTTKIPKKEKQEKEKPVKKKRKSKDDDEESEEVPLIKKRHKKSDEVEEPTRKSIPRAVKTSPVKDETVGNEEKKETSKKHKKDEDSYDESPKNKKSKQDLEIEQSEEESEESEKENEKKPAKGRGKKAAAKGSKKRKT